METGTELRRLMETRLSRARRRTTSTHYVRNRNRNNFRSKEECERKCPDEEDVCDLPVVVGPCEAAIRRWASVDGKCRRFIYGGCGGNENNFRSKRECKRQCPEEVDVCDLPVVAGPCEAAIPRWAFRNGRCWRFIYGGCRGNRNNFKTKQECQRSCAYRG